MPNRPTFSTTIQNILILTSVTLAYIWVSIPILSEYSLQAFAVATILYFIIKKNRNGKLSHILPTRDTAEMSIATFALLILVGSTGNFNSIFYPFTFVHLFFLTMSCDRKTAIIGTTAIMFFHYTLSPTIDAQTWSHLITIPIVMVFFLFAKDQHEEVIKDRHIIEMEKEQIELENIEIEELKQKIAQLENEKA